MQLEADNSFMRAAIEEAKAAKAAGDLPFGAVVVRNGDIVGSGGATNGTTGDVTDHAEMAALRAACRTLMRNALSDCTIVCTNEPCNMCASAIFQAMIPVVVIGATRRDLGGFLRDRKIGIAELAADSGYDITVRSGVLREEVLQLFADVHRA